MNNFGKESACIERRGFDPCLEDTLELKRQPIQYSCLGNPTVHGSALRVRQA